LSIAAEKSYFIFEYLLKEGIDPNKKKDNYLSPLLTAAWHGFTNKIKLLLEYGANLNEVDKEGSALHLAIKGGDSVDAMDFLLSKGIDTTIKDAKGRTALDLAIEKGAKDEAEILIRYGVDFDEGKIKELFNDELSRNQYKYTYRKRGDIVYIDNFLGLPEKNKTFLGFYYTYYDNDYVMGRLMDSGWDFDCVYNGKRLTERACELKREKILKHLIFYSEKLKPIDQKIVNSERLNYIL
jgi:hypothetical protein